MPTERSIEIVVEPGKIEYLGKLEASIARQSQEQSQLALQAQRALSGLSGMMEARDRTIEDLGKKAGLTKGSRITSIRVTGQDKLTFDVVEEDPVPETQPEVSAPVAVSESPVS